MVKSVPSTKEAYELFHKGALALQRAEYTGMRVDMEYCKRKKEELTIRIAELEQKIYESNFGKKWSRSIGGKRPNLNSNPQLSRFLYSILKLKPVRFTESGQPATDEEALSELDIPELDMLLEMRKFRKIRDTYLDAFMREQVNGYIHPFFNLHLTKTFRSSSDSPNFQNIPKRDKEATKICREALFPRPGHQFVSMDYSAIEVKMAVCYVEDEKLCYDVLHGDMHKDMAIELYMLDDLDKRHSGEAVLRQGAKNGFVFPQFYGDYYGNCVLNLLKWARQAYLKDDTPALVHLKDKELITLDKSGNVKKFDKFLEHVRKVEDQFWNVRYKQYSRWKDKVWYEYQKKGYIEMKTGFRCYGLMSKKDITNYPFQGTAFHCLLWAFVEIDRVFREHKMDSRLVSQIHDEITADILPEECDNAIKLMVRIATEDIRENWKWINIPLTVEVEKAEVDKSWGERKFLNLP
jgi:DNA polymerase-1